VKQIAYRVSITAMLAILIAFNSCVDTEFDEPPAKEIPVGTVLTIGDIRQMYLDSVLNLGRTTYKFENDYSVYAVVTMDDKSGNIYKTAYIQDETGGINLHLLSSGGLYEGDSVRVYLKGLILGDYSEMIQLDSVHVDNNIVKQATQRFRTPEVVTIDQILTGQYQAHLVKIENVQFLDADLGTTLSDPVGLETLNKTLEDENGQTIIVRTSGYASFAGNSVPSGRGSVIAIVGQYNADWQLYVRGIDELVMPNNRFGDVDTIFSADFENVTNGVEIAIAGWKNINQTGVKKWMGFIGTDLTTAKISGDGNANVSWLIFPSQAVNNAKLSFATRAGNLQGAVLEVLVSSNYDGGDNPQDFTWTTLPAIFATSPSSSFGEWTNSGAVDLAAYNGNVYVAFRYTTAAGQNGQFYLDHLLYFQVLI
jgi:hypothetical protein